MNPTILLNPVSPAGVGKNVDILNGHGMGGDLIETHSGGGL